VRRDDRQRLAKILSGFCLTRQLCGVGLIVDGTTTRTNDGTTTTTTPKIEDCQNDSRVFDERQKYGCDV